jgi:hypothetical protein
MVIPIRHVTEDELTKEEKDEFETIKKEYIFDKYDYILEACSYKKSIPAHFHLHLLIIKDFTSA